NKSAGWSRLNAFVSPEPRCRLSPRQEIHFCPLVRSLNCSASAPHPVNKSAGWSRLNSFEFPEPRCRLSPRQEIRFLLAIRSLNVSTWSQQGVDKSGGGFRLTPDKPLKLFHKTGARY